MNPRIDVMDINSYPSILTNYLYRRSEQFEKYNSIEDKGFRDDFSDQALDLIKEYDIIAYHYTKEISPGYFAANGLRCLSFDEHKKWVIQKLKERKVELADEEWKRLKSLEQQAKCDEGKLYFVYDSEEDSGTRDFLRYFGGECIYGQITDGYESNDISYALEKIGIPVIVKFYIGISDIQNGSPIDTMISVYAKNFNKNFRIVHRQGFITQQQILPEQILNVIEKKID